MLMGCIALTFRFKRTYQEGYLAKRRLIFTDRQIVYVCGYSLCAESFAATVTHDEAAGVPRVHLTDLFRGQDAITFSTCAEEYAMRELSYGSDALNAFLGILNSWTDPPANSTLAYSSRDALTDHTHVWGVLMTETWLELCWFHNNATNSRRHGFPTWAWVGWVGSILTEIDLHYGARLDIEFGARASQEEPDKSPLPTHLFSDEWIPLSEYFTKSKASKWTPGNAPTLLKFTAICPRVHLEYSSSRTAGTNGSGWTAYIPLSLNRARACFVYWDLEISQDADLSNCVAITISYTTLLDQNSKSNLGENRFLLVIPSAVKGVYERIGLMLPSLAVDNERYHQWELPLSEEQTIIIG
jgi:hypothetical protein